MDSSDHTVQDCWYLAG